MSIAHWLELEGDGSFQYMLDRGAGVSEIAEAARDPLAAAICQREQAASSGAASHHTIGRHLNVNPNLKEAQIKGAFTNRQLAIARHSDFELALDCAREDGAVTAKEIAAAFNQMGVQTARGGLWTPENIYRQPGKQKERMTPERPPASSAPTFADPDGILTPDGLKRLRAVMAANKMKPRTTGKLMNAIGFNRYDTSVGPGLKGLAPLKKEHVLALEKWVATQEVASRG